VLHPWRVPPLITPRALGLGYSRVTLQSDGARLAAWHIPCPGARAGLVLCHGHDDSRACFSSLLRPLHLAGFELLLFDFRSMGVSKGGFCSYGYHEQEDVHAAIAWLRANTAVERIGLYGISMGGSAALLAAADDPGVAAVATDCAFARLEDMIEQRYHILPRAWRRPVGDGMRYWAERWAGRVAHLVDPEAAVRRWKPRPLLVIHGERDGLTPVEHGRRLARAAGELGELWIVPGACHARSRYNAKSEYRRRLTAFFRQHLLEHPSTAK
jgi:dipeptidyl aminopeptidase/acylaminoacyl peptidase